MQHRNMLHRTSALIISLVVVSRGMQLPKYFKRCDFYAPDLPSCIGDAGSRVIPKLVIGNADFGLKPVTPFKFQDVTSPYGGNFKFRLVNGTAGDLRDIRYLSVTFNRDTFKTNATVYLPDMTIHGYYEIDGKVDDLLIRGRGLAKIIFTDVAFDFIWNLEKIRRNGNEYIDVVDVTIKYNIDGATYFLSGLYGGGDTTLAERAHGCLNTNWQTLAKIIAPSVVTAFREIALYVGRGVDDKIPIHEMFRF